MTLEEYKKFAEDHEAEFCQDDRSILKGINILAKYCGKDDDIISGADHDIVFFGVSLDKMTEKDVLSLHKNGFHYDDDIESWAKFVCG